MGLIRAGVGALGGTMADQWKEFFYCDAIDKDTLVVKGAKRITSRSSNTKGNDNIISNGSGIAVADGQCMIIVEQGKVVEVCAEPGEFTYDTSTEPSIFTGSLGKAILDTFKTIGKRFAYGGDTGKDQRVYYFNTKEIVDNKFGTATPIPFRVVDSRIGLDLDTGIRCNGVYSYKITNPLLFYANVCGNVEQDYDRSEIDSQLKTEFISALQPAFSRLSDMEMRPNQIPAHTMELCDLMNETLTKKWSEARGISVVSIAMNPVSIPDEDAESIKELQRAAALSNPGLAAGSGRSDAHCSRKQRRRDGGLHGHGHGRKRGRRERSGAVRHGGRAEGCRSSAERKRVDLLLRRGEQGQVLLRVRQAQTCRRSQVQVRQVRLGARGSHASAEVLPRMRRSVQRL